MQLPGVVPSPSGQMGPDDTLHEAGGTVIQLPACTWAKQAVRPVKSSFEDLNEADWHPAESPGHAVHPPWVCR